MLKVNNLTKLYTSKKGADVVALNDISLKFQDKGLIFILGKSGSGKSTLLNILGGLDKFDYGEIIIDGRSSMSFSNSDFDSYRNTYLGFVFQDFLLLEEFSVGENITLAMQLQEQKCSNESLEEILTAVDLLGYEHRMPNELSGGQKQRVAIARALIKNPSVILADEPTGALDNVTSRQVFNTLKTLSEEKLVIVVSHDREFAEEFGDRIIELRDGSIISDTTRQGDWVDVEDEIEVLDSSLIMLPAGKPLSRVTIRQINDVLENTKERLFIQLFNEEQVKTDFPNKIKSSRKSNEKNFKETDMSKFEDFDEFSKTELIQSKLPFWDKLKFAFSNMKAKKIRLAITMFLSILALSFFGFASILSDYDRVGSFTQTFYQSDAYMMQITKEQKIDSGDVLVDVPLNNANLNYLDDLFNKNTIKSYDLGQFVNENSWQTYIPDTAFNAISSHPIIRPTSISGILESAEGEIEIAFGSHPKELNECAISDLFADYFFECGMRVAMPNGSTINIQPTNYEQLMGKTMRVGGVDYTITGVYKTNYYIYKDIFKNKTFEEVTNDKELNNIFTSYQTDEKMFMSKILVNEGFLENYKSTKKSYDAKIIADFGSSTQNPYGQAIVADVNYGLEIGEVYMSALYYRNMMYGEDSTASFDQLALDFSDPTELRFYIKATENELINTNSFSAKYKVMGIYNDIEVLGEPILYMNQSDVTSIVNAIFVPNAVLTSANLSGEDLSKALNELFNMGYKVSARFNNSLEIVDGLMTNLVGIFYIVSAGLAVFVMLLLFNFISTSIEAKAKEIGILRALGARAKDVVNIFVIEGFILAMIMILISVPLVYVGSVFASNYLTGILPINLINFKPIQVVLMSSLTIIIVILSSFFPVLKISKKKPIEAIRQS